MVQETRNVGNEGYGRRGRDADVLRRPESGLDCLICAHFAGLDCLISGLNCRISGLDCIRCAQFDGG